MVIYRIHASTAACENIYHLFNHFIVLSRVICPSGLGGTTRRVALKNLITSLANIINEPDFEYDNTQLTRGEGGTPRGQDDNEFIRLNGQNYRVKS